jgi:hypothetical protein
MRLKSSKIKMITTGLISTFLMFAFVSCAPAAEKIDVDSYPAEETVISEEEIEELEETVEAVDYANAQIGAEIKGYIPFFLCTDTENYIQIEIKNTSDFTWRKSGQNMVRIGYHYFGQDVDYSDYDQTTRTILPDNLEPGEIATVEVLINDITNKGFYVIQIDPLVEGEFWFSSKDVPMLQSKVYFGPCTK